MKRNPIPTRAKLILLTLLLALLPGAASSQTQDQTRFLAPASQPQFIYRLPNPLDNVLVPDTQTYPGYDYYRVSMSQVSRQLGIVDPATGNKLSTTVWGYNGSFPGPTFEARTGRPVKVRFTNDLVDAQGVALPHLLPLDTTVDCGPLDVFGNPSFCRPFVRTVPHLHGGHVADHSAGDGQAWFSAGFSETGPKWSRQVYDYPNDQEAATLWYHDHAQGITRLNVYAGLAGLYLLRDDNERKLQDKGILPAYPYEVPLILQDRMFHADGSLAYPKDPFLDAKGNPATFDPVTGKVVPSIVPNLFGDFILANGVVWPYMEVQPRPYRFRILNASDSRFYTLSIPKLKKSLYVVGGDGGFLDSAAAVEQIVLAPGERADVVVDFSAAVGQTLILTNTAPTPYPNGSAPDPATTGRILQLRVAARVTPVSWVPLPVVLRAPIERLKPTTGLAPREVLLSEGTDDIGRAMPQLGTTTLGPRLYADPVTETPRVGTIETWAFVNTGDDTYPLHLHGFQLQVIERQAFDKAAYVPGKPGALVFTAKPMPPRPGETGWKDTVQAAPGEVTRVAVRFDRSGAFTWECPILSHQDHEMMRPLVVVR